MTDLYRSETYLADLDAAASAAVGMEDLRGARVLITGAGGTIGSFVTDVLLRYNGREKAGMTVYAAGRDPKRLEARFAGLSGGALTPVKYDVFAPVDFPFAADYILHAAGNAYPAVFASDPVGTILGNVEGTHHLLDYGRDCGARRLLYVSSGEVYGQGDLSLDAFDESYSGWLDVTAPRSCYPASKRLVETLCASYTQQYGLETVSVRPCHTYGPWMTAGDNRANVQFIRNVLAGEDIVLKSPGTQLRSYCYAGDCASALLTVLLRGESGQSYNSANPAARATIAELAHIIAEAGGRKVIFADPTAAELAQRSPIAKQVLASDKLEALGWRGRYDVPAGVAHVLAILRESGAVA